MANRHPTHPGLPRYVGRHLTLVIALTIVHAGGDDIVSYWHPQIANDVVAAARAQDSHHRQRGPYPRMAPPV